MTTEAVTLGYQEFVERCFDAINAAFYDDELPTPIINAFMGYDLDAAGCYKRNMLPDSMPSEIANVFVKRGVTAPGHVINIHIYGCTAMVDSGAFDNVYTVILDTMAHEMVHFWCALNGIEETDCDDVHNFRFRDAALAHGLDCEEREGSFSATSISLFGWLVLEDYLDYEMQNLMDESSDY